MFFKIFKNTTLSEAEFSKKFATALQKKVLGLEIVSIHDLTIHTQFRQSKKYNHILSACYTEYLKNPTAISSIVEKSINGIREFYDSKTSISIDRILPVLKDKRFLDHLESLHPGHEITHVYQKYNSELYIFYVEDKEDTITYLTQKHLQMLRLCPEYVKTKALENLKDVLVIERHGENGYYGIATDGNYESSLILLDIWNHDYFPVQGNFIIGIPSRRHLLITGDKDSENLHKMYDIVAEINLTDSYLVSDKLFEWKNGIFEVFQ